MHITPLTADHPSFVPAPQDVRVSLFSVFFSLDGEINPFGQGCPSTFVRFAGCNLDCAFCDSPATHKATNGEETLVSQVVQRVVSIGCPKVTITGGEPLLQPEAFSSLVLALARRGFSMTCETNGSQPPPILHPQLHYVVDVKLPGSGMYGHMPSVGDPVWLHWGRQSQATLKYVVSNASDFEVARRHIEAVRNHAMASQVAPPVMAISPVMGGDNADITPSRLLLWVRDAELFDVVLNFQLHKFLELVEDSPGAKK